MIMSRLKILSCVMRQLAVKSEGGLKVIDVAVVLKILIYLVFVVTAGSLLAVPLYEAGQWAIDTDLIPALKKFRFPKYLNRGVLIAALIGLWPFLKSLGLNHRGAIGLTENKFAKKHLLIGALLGAVGLSTVSVGLILTGRLEVLPKILPIWFISAAATAVAVAVIEEFFFRGALLGVLLKQLSPRVAVLVLSLLFAVLHFIKPHASVKHWDGEVHWWTGFEVLSYSFWQFKEPQLLVGGLLTLFMVGVVLAYATLKTQSLFLAIGLHGGWVFVLRLVQMGTTRNSPPDWLVGKPLITGLVPCALVVLSGIFLMWYLGRESREA